MAMDHAVEGIRDTSYKLQTVLRKTDTHWGKKKCFLLAD